MGYDMQVTYDVKDASVYAGPQAQFLAMRERCNLALGNARFGGCDGYFDLNGTGMSLIRSVMRELGMLTDSAEPPSGALDTASWEAARDADYGTPGIPAFKLMWNDEQLVCPREIAAAIAAYDAHCNPEELAGAVLHAVHLEMADAECRDGDCRHRTHPAETTYDGATTLAMWRTWISYLRLAAVAGGFLVY